MRQVFRIGILVSALLIAVAGCAAMDWFRDMSGTRQAESDQRAEGSTALSAEGNARSRVQILHVQFGSGRSDLNNTAQTYLLVLIKKLRENPKLSVDLKGYADSVGSRDSNLQLSQKRVEAVRRYLVERGVESARIRSAGLGQLPDRGTPEEQAKNRRVTVNLMAASD